MDRQRNGFQRLTLFNRLNSGCTELDMSASPVTWSLLHFEINFLFSLKKGMDFPAYISFCMFLLVFLEGCRLIPFFFSRNFGFRSKASTILQLWSRKCNQSFQPWTGAAWIVATPGLTVTVDGGLKSLEIVKICWGLPKMPQRWVKNLSIFMKGTLSTFIFSQGSKHWHVSKLRPLIVWKILRKALGTWFLGF